MCADHGESSTDSGQADFVAAKVAICHPHMVSDHLGARTGEVNQSHGLFLRTAARSGNAGDRHGNLGAGMAQRALGHFTRHLFRHCTVLRDERYRHAQHFGLGLVGVRDDDALHHGR